MVNHAEEVLAYRRIINNDHMLIVQNLSEKIVETSFACVRQSRTDLLNRQASAIV
jgi:hypothetical protein